MKEKKTKVDVDMKTWEDADGKTRMRMRITGDKDVIKDFANQTKNTPLVDFQNTKTVLPPKDEPSPVIEVEKVYRKKQKEEPIL